MPGLVVARPAFTLAVNPVVPGPVSVATRSSIYQQGLGAASLDPTTLDGTSNHVMRVEVDATGVFLRYGLWGWGGSTPPANDVVVQAVFIASDGTRTPVTFNGGSSSVRINSATRNYVDSDPIAVSVARGTTVKVRTYYACDPIVATGDMTLNSPTITNVAVTSGQVRSKDQPIAGPGIPAGTTIASVVGSTVTMGQNATATASGVALSITPIVPVDWFSDTGNGAPWAQKGNHLADVVEPPVVGGTPPYNNTRYYSPVAIYSRSISPSSTPSFALLGDSNFHGQGDDQAPPATNDLSGLARRALNDRWPYLHVAEGGMGILQITADPTHGAWGLLADGPQYLIIGMVTNDLGVGGSTGASIAAAVNQVAAYAKAHGTSKVIACTCPPNTSSTDNWATVANQTPLPTATETKRVDANTIYRTLANMNPGGSLESVDWVADCASIVEVDASNTLTLNGGRWQVTANGLTPPSMGTAPHYTSAGHAAAATMIADAITHVVAGERGGISKAI